MRKRAREKPCVKKGTVVDKDISQEPAMKKLRKLYQSMTPEEKERTFDYLKQKEGLDYGEA